MRTNHSHSGCRRVLALLLTVLTVMSMLPGAAFAAQPTTYRDPAEHWMNAGSRTNELDINAVVSHETFYCHTCKQYTSFTIWRTPEYTRDGQTALTRNVLYSDGTTVDGEGTGSILDGDPGIDAFYTGYHWTKSMCDNCGVMNANGGTSHYGYSKNVYNLYDCASGFSEDLKDVVTYEYADDTYHTKTVEGGHYCEFCFGTVHTHSSTLERHNLKTEVKAQLDKQRFAVVTSCADCGYTKTEYVAAKSVVADYYGAVDGKAHTLTVSDLSESGVTAKIRYGNSAEACTLVTPPSYTEEGQYTVYYAVTYTYKGVSMTENGVAYVWLHDESTREPEHPNPAHDPSISADSAEHNYVYLDTVAPTCTTLGYDRYLCSICGAVDKRNYQNATGHAIQSILIREADCEHEGKTLEICRSCGEVKETLTPKGEHQVKTYKVAATCTAPGYTVRECDICGDRQITDITAVKGHSFVVNVVAPTCTTGGHTQHICKDCGESYFDSYTQATGHNWDDGTVIKDPTCNNAGVIEYRCKVCDATKLEDYDGDGDDHNHGNVSVTPVVNTTVKSGTGHRYTSAVTAPTCTEMGFTTYTCVDCGDTYKADYVDATGHTYKAVVTKPTCTKMGYTTYTCKDCGNSYKSDYTELLGHDYTAVVTAPTCTEGGYTAYTCTRCGDSYVDDVTEALGHDWKAPETLADSTCNSDGVKEYDCSRCDAHYHEAISAKGHNPGPDATCLNPQTCKDCGAVLAPATGHQYTKKMTKPTCTKMGYTTYTCDRCGDSYKSDYTELLGHDYVAKVTDPTCTEGGYTTFTCSRCGDSYVTDYTDPTGHDWDAGTKITDATCNGEGVLEHRCKSCDETYLEAVSAKGHNPGSKATCTEDQICRDCGAVIEKAHGHDFAATVTAPTCTELGYTTYACKNCDKTYISNYVKSTGHKESNWIIDRKPTTEAEGSRHKECVTCHEKLVTEPIAKLYLYATTDSRGEATVGEYLVIVTDTSSGKPITNAAVELNKDGTISVRFPDGRLLDYGNHTTVYVLKSEDKSPVKGVQIYFFAKALDQVRPGGVVAFVTSRYTMDAKDPMVRKYLAQRADLLGAIRLPNNAFRANAGTDVVSDIIFLQKRDHPIDIEPEWVHLGENDDGFSINNYFVDHPEMILGRQSSESTQYGRQDFTVEPIAGLELSDQLHDAIKYIRGTYEEAELPELGEGEEVSETLPADPDVKNYSFTVVDGEVYYRENSIMVKPDLNATARERVKGMVELRDCVRSLIDLQMDEYTPDSAISEKQAELNRLYDAYTAKYGLINDRGNRLAFADDDSYYLLCSLEVLDENGELERKADFFTKRTIKQQHSVDHVDTAVEALGVSIGERACVDLPFMASLMGGQDKIPQIVEDLRGVLFKDPSTGPFDYAEGGEHWDKGWQTADEYLSGNVRRKLRQAERAAEQYPEFRANVEALRQAQPRDLDASEIEVRLGTTWIDKEYFQRFMYELLDTPYYLQGRIKINYSPYTAEWQIEGKSQIPYNNVAAYTTYGTDRANAYRLLEDALNLRDTRIYDTVTDADGKEKRVLNAKETTLAAQKQQLIRDAFKDWIWKDPERRAALVKQYNEEMNSTRPREYDGSHIVFSGMNPEITLRPHQRDAIAHVLYGGNTLLAHEVGAGKTFEMVAAAMESKRLGLCSKSIFVVPNHLTDQWAAEFLRLYPSANILVTTKKDFQKHNRKKFCARIATGDYDAVIIGHSQFEKIPISPERQIRLIEEQIEEITNGIEEVKENNGERFTIKELERTKKGLEARLKKLLEGKGKDDVVTFEQLGVDRMFVDESDNYKNLFLYTKMRNVAGLSTTDAQKSSDMFAKCRYMDELTGGRGVVFATGTPVSNSMTELFTIQRYLQYDRLQELGMGHFDCWASRFGETTTALELAPEGTGYRARTRFAKFFNLPELMNLFKEVADIKTADQLDLPIPEVEYHNFVSKPTEIQKEMVKDLSERASRVHSGAVDAHEDNMLKITSDGRKLGLDQRIINPMLPDEDGTKVNQCVGNILQFWRDGEDQKLTQLVFCDISTPKGRTVTDRAAKAPIGILDSPEIHALETLIPLEPEEKERPFTIYEDIRQKLMQGGMPEEQIAFIHDADTEVRKRELFAKVRSGQVRVLIGSTQKMGAGTNVQDRLIALHDLDCPWRPRDLTQRKGRIERQGNQNELVHVCRYVTEGAFDAYLWQTVENKQKFISQIMTSKSPVRSCEDIDETALSFAEIKALCAGDPRIKERMDLDVEVSKLKIMKADHQSKQYRLEDRLLKYFPEQIEQNKGFIRGFEADMKTLEAHPLPQEGFIGMVIRGDNLTDKENAGAALIDAAREVKSTDPVEIGSYRGFTMAVEFSSFTKGYMLTLKGEMTHRVELGEDPRGNLTRIDNALAKMPERLAAVQTQLDNLYQQQAAAKAEVGKPFPYEADLTAKTARLVELDTQLNLNGGKMQPQPEQVVAKQERPSILERLKQPLPQKPNQKHKSHTLEASL